MKPVLVYNRWPVEGIEVNDLGLKAYISLTPRIIPRTGARYAQTRFHKSKTNIVERFMNRVMVPGHKSKKHYRSSGHMTGKAQNVAAIMEQVLIKVEAQTKENPIRVLVKAIENAAPREEIVSIEYGGARYPKSVECAPQRRVDLVLKYITQGAYGKSFNSKKSIVDALTDEIIAAYRCNASSAAISRKLELERQADASR